MVQMRRDLGSPSFMFKFIFISTVPVCLGFELFRCSSLFAFSFAIFFTLGCPSLLRFSSLLFPHFVPFPFPFVLSPRILSFSLLPFPYVLSSLAPFSLSPHFFPSLSPHFFPSLLIPSSLSSTRSLFPSPLPSSLPTPQPIPSSHFLSPHAFPSPLPSSPPLSSPLAPPMARLRHQVAAVMSRGLSPCKMLPGRCWRRLLFALCERGCRRRKNASF